MHSDLSLAWNAVGAGSHYAAVAEQIVQKMLSQNPAEAVCPGACADAWHDGSWKLASWAWACGCLAEDRGAWGGGECVVGALRYLQRPQPESLSRADVNRVLELHTEEYLQLAKGTKDCVYNEE